MIPERVPEPEILDSLPPDDPRARASRRDLRLLNRFMGTRSFFLRTLRHRAPRQDPVLELGAGEATLATPVVRAGFRYTGLDQFPPPTGFAYPCVESDVLTFSDYAAFPIVIMNMFLHHFSSAEIRQIGSACLAHARLVAVCEPWKTTWSRRVMQLSAPLWHPVTRHDADISIRGGFEPGEIFRGLGATPDRWIIQEHAHWRGTVRMILLRRED